jgi:hypothetical protein
MNCILVKTSYSAVLVTAYRRHHKSKTTIKEYKNVRVIVIELQQHCFLMDLGSVALFPGLR